MVVNTNHPTIRIPASAIRELEQIERSDWAEGVSLADLLDWINSVVAQFRPGEIGEDSRASGEFTPRTFRHYQTLGCIDTPKRVGQRVFYGFRHYLQGLVIRKLLWERVTSENIAALMADRTTTELKQLLLEGVEITPRQATGVQSKALPCSESWQRLTILPGLEFHLRNDLPRPKPAELDHWLTLIEAAIRRAVRK